MNLNRRCDDVAKDVVLYYNSIIKDEKLSKQVQISKSNRYCFKTFFNLLIRFDQQRQIHERHARVFNTNEKRNKARKITQHIFRWNVLKNLYYLITAQFKVCLSIRRYWNYHSLFVMGWYWCQFSFMYFNHSSWLVNIACLLERPCAHYWHCALSYALLRWNI